jgi:hypothetical protein
LSTICGIYNTQDVSETSSAVTAKINIVSEKVLITKVGRETKAETNARKKTESKYDTTET